VSAIVDPRICIISSEINQGSSAARNRGVSLAAGEVVFFTDDDVETNRDWILNGLRYFSDDAVVGIEGKIVYVSADYLPRYSDRTVQNLLGGEYMTANAAYRKTALVQAGPFDEALWRYQDMDLALRVQQLGRIVFAEDAVVCHMRESYTVKSFMREAIKIGLWLDFEKCHGDSNNRIGPVIYPSHIITILFPPLILTKMVVHRHPNRRDILMLLLIYPRLVFERYIIWRWALHNRTIVI